MYNCYNEGIAYLKEKLGTKEVHSGYGTKNNPTIIYTVYLHENIIPNSDEHHIELLLKQYYMGIAPQKELYYKLINLGVILSIEDEADITVDFENWWFNKNGYQKTEAIYGKQASLNADLIDPMKESINVYSDELEKIIRNKFGI